MKSVRLLVFGVVSIALSFLLGTARGVFGFASMVEPTPWSYVVFGSQTLMLALGLALILWWAVVRFRPDLMDRAILAPPHNLRLQPTPEPRAGAAGTPFRDTAQGL